MIAKEAEEALSELQRCPVIPDAYFTAGDRLTIVCYSILKAMKPNSEAGFLSFSNTQAGDLFSSTLSIVR